jgi:hypothetical protein
MATVQQSLSQLTAIDRSPSGPRVETTIAQELRDTAATRAALRTSPGITSVPGSIRIAVITDPAQARSLHPALEKHPQWMMFRLRENAGAELCASHTHLLYQLWTLVAGEWSGMDAAAFREGKIITPTFRDMRPV